MSAPIAPTATRPATPLQRLRLVSLGLPVDRNLTAYWADEMLAAAAAEGLDSDPPTEHQIALAGALGVAVDPGDDRGSLGERVYEFYLALAWVFSVWRSATGEASDFWAGLSLPRPKALAVAQSLLERGGLHGLHDAQATRDDSDLFCAIDSKTLLTDSYRATLRALGLRSRSGWVRSLLGLLLLWCAGMYLV